MGIPLEMETQMIQLFCCPASNKGLLFEILSSVRRAAYKEPQRPSLRLSVKATSEGSERYAWAMNLVEFGFVYVGLLCVFIFVLLFGETPLFQATPVSFVHWLITSGIWEGVW